MTLDLQKISSECFVCENELDVIYYEVDLGVGIEIYPIGFTCLNCMNEYSICNDCGICMDGRSHFKYCSEFIIEINKYDYN